MSIKKIISKFLLLVLIAMLINGCVWYFMGADKALQFLGGYIIELSLSVDNLFLFLLIFSSFGVKPKYQKRILNFGIICAIILRLIFIVLGVTVVNSFKWIIYIFGILLIVSGVKIFVNKNEAESFEDSKLLKLLKKFIPVTEELHNEKFFVRINNVLHATPLFAILFLIEGSDILFAIDSIPAIFSITTDPLIIYASNILAILGLRTLYFLLERLHSSFRYVKYGVGAILLFTGVKLAISFKYHISVGTSILLIVLILLISVIMSIAVNNKQKEIQG